MAKNIDKEDLNHIEETDPWKIMKIVVLPKAQHDEENFQFVGVNGRTFQVPKTGKPVEVPLPVYQVLINSEELKDEADEYRRKSALKN